MYVYNINWKLIINELLHLCSNYTCKTAVLELTCRLIKRINNKEAPCWIRHFLLKVVGLTQYSLVTEIDSYSVINQYISLLSYLINVWLLVCVLLLYEVTINHGQEGRSARSRLRIAGQWGDTATFKVK